LKQNVIPIFAPLTHANGTMLNTNADTIASVLAISLSKHFDVRLIFCFEKTGVLQDVKNEKSVITNLNKSTYQKLLKEGSFHDGILPKLENAFNAIESGVKEVLIGEHTNLLANTSYETKGTLITQS
jgi:acetylglutamate kinase